MRLRLMVFMVIFVFVLLFSDSTLLQAQTQTTGTVQFAWDPHEQASAIKQFKLYQSRTSPVCVGNIPPTVAPIATFIGGTLTTGSIPLPMPGRYFWSLTAETTDPIESDCSNEVSMVIKPKPPKVNTVKQTAEVIFKAPVGGAVKLAELLGVKEKNVLKKPKVIYSEEE